MKEPMSVIYLLLPSRKIFTINSKDNNKIPFPLIPPLTLSRLSIKLGETATLSKQPGSSQCAAGTLCVLLTGVLLFKTYFPPFLFFGTKLIPDIQILTSVQFPKHLLNMGTLLHLHHYHYQVHAAILPFLILVSCDCCNELPQWW